MPSPKMERTMFPKKARTMKTINTIRININPKNPNIPNIMFYFFLVRRDQRIYQRMMAAKPLIRKKANSGIHTNKKI